VVVWRWRKTWCLFCFWLVCGRLKICIWKCKCFPHAGLSDPRVRRVVAIGAKLKRRRPKGQHCACLVVLLPEAINFSAAGSRFF
jgi:hypothetical protein